MNLPILLGRYVEDAEICEMGVTERFYLSRAGGICRWVDVMHVVRSAGSESRGGGAAMALHHDRRAYDAKEWKLWFLWSNLS